MPNWVTNRIIIHNGKEDILFNHLIKEDGNLEFDFNTIIPMPEELDVEKSKKGHDGLILYLAKINPYMLGVGEMKDKLSIEEFDSLIKKLFGDSYDKYNKDMLEALVNPLITQYEKDINEVISIGEIYVNNYLKYGDTDWFKWRIRNWGCKWNASNTYVTGNTIFFDTPWAPSVPVIDKFAEFHPELEFTYEFAEEQTAFWCGRYYYKNGKCIIRDDYEEFSKDAYELYFSIWGGEEDYKYDEKLDNYVFIEKDE